ncbi:serine/threonine protein kinase, partial [Streptomyces sp. YC537]|nr:serine/threonine protein kinase [Streptomyces boluensis]
VRTAVVTGVLALALAAGGTGFGVWYASRDDKAPAGATGTVREADPTPTDGTDGTDRPEGSRVPKPTPSSSAGDRQTPSSGGKDRTGGGGSDTDEPAPDDSTQAPAKDTAPAGYRTVQDPLGFQVAVPDGFTRSYEAPRVYYYSPGKEYRLGFHPQPQDPQGSLAVMQQAHRDGPDDYPGYRGGSVRETTHNGHPAALWEFTWDGTAADGGPRHTYDLSWDQNGKMYDLWISAPSQQQAAAKRHFDVALETFVP